MRIIGGEFRGRKFNPPADKWPTRPTTDISKESLYNILHNRMAFEDVKMLDLFGGTGSHSYEAISRGCRDVLYVDKYVPCTKYVKEVSKTFGIEESLRIRVQDAVQYLKSASEDFDYIFAGPPYALSWLNDIPNRIFARSLLRDDGILVVEHDQTNNFERHPNFDEVRKYGGTYFSFFSLIHSIDD